MDIDGTMVDAEGKISASTREAIQRAREKGHKMVVCSGRSRFQIYDELLALGFSGIVGGAGAFVEVDGQEIYHAYIDEEHRKSSYEYLEKNSILYCYQANDSVVLTERSLAGIVEIYKGLGMSQERLDRLIGRMHLTQEPWKNARNEKIIYYNAPFSVEKVHADMAPYFDVVAISLDGLDEYSGEIGINGINKATGMELYLNHVGIRRENCIAVGDGPNDLQMMEYAGVGVAMGNARDDVKKRADMVTTAIGEDGIYRAFEVLGLMN